MSPEPGERMEPHRHERRRERDGHRSSRDRDRDRDHERRREHDGRDESRDRGGRDRRHRGRSRSTSPQVIYRRDKSPKQETSSRRRRSRSRSRSVERSRRSFRRRSRSRSRRSRSRSRRSRSRSRRSRSRSRSRDRDRRDRELDRRRRRRRGGSRERGSSRNEPSATVHVSGLPVATAEGEVAVLLQPWAAVQHVRMLAGRDGTAAAVQLADVDAARTLMDAASLQPLYLDGQRLYLEYARSDSVQYDGASPSGPSVMSRVDWLCSRCRTMNFGRRHACFQCGEARTSQCMLVPPEVSSETRRGTCSLVVNGLAAGTEESSLYLRLAGVVSVKAVRLVVQPAGVEASGPFALVDLHSVDDARRVKSLLDGAPEVDGGSLAVEFTREPPTSWLSNGGRGGAAAAAIAAARSASQYGNSSGAHADVPVWAPAEFKEGETDEQQAGAAVAAEAGYVLDPESGYYYDVSSGLYYDGNTGLFYNGHTQQWYSYDANTQQYTSYVASTRKASVKESAVSAVSAVTIGNKKQHSEAMELWNQRKQEEQEDAPTTSPAVPVPDVSAPKPVVIKKVAAITVRKPVVVKKIGTSTTAPTPPPESTAPTVSMAPVTAVTSAGVIRGGRIRGGAGASLIGRQHNEPTMGDAPGMPPPPPRGLVSQVDATPPAATTAAVGGLIRGGRIRNAKLPAQAAEELPLVPQSEDDAFKMHMQRKAVERFNRRA